MDLVTRSILWGVTLLLAHFLWNYFRSPLKSFPGPIATRFTNIWRLMTAFGGQYHITNIELHRRHGPAVRVGPKTLSLSDPALINKAYATRDPWTKSNMYNVADTKIKGGRAKNLFTNQDEKWHEKYSRPIRNFYTMTRVLDMEPGVDMTINLFLEKVRDRFVSTGKACDMDNYVYYYAWDVMSQITLSTTFGMIETGSDNLKILDASRKTVDYFASIGQMPSLDIIMDKNPINSIGRPLLKWAVAVAAEAYQKRKKEETPLNRNPDFLDRYIEAENKHPDVVNGNTVMMYMLSNLAAGSDTTATSMCGAIYYVLKHPAVYTRLKEELSSTKLSTPVQWKEIRGLSYLDAVMREAMRVHPGISLPLERLAPKGGFTLPDGRFIAEDTIVGMNPWVINRDPVFGADPDSFIPEWWLPGKGESDEMFQARFLKMKSASFTFGGGSRICLGQFVSVLESYKFVATLFDQFDMELAHPGNDWKVTNSWFLRQENFPTVMKEAKP